MHGEKDFIIDKKELNFLLKEQAKEINQKIKIVLEEELLNTNSALLLHLFERLEIK